ncbi:hypothetical protein [Ruminococcus sp. HUN007]|uniref:hypothetical protein n=1 Tax=Ruminococcus sp. HUN007 TaxID=1514668 RepID=UPI0005D25C8D|nr:hypothetical protein [Ruminococcus sp. HUN007]
MKRNLVKLIAGIFAFSVLTLSFCGCEKQNGSGQSSVNGSASEASEPSDPETSGSEEDTGDFTVLEIAPEHEYENIDQVEYCNDRYYIYEQMSEGVEKEVSVLSSVSEKSSADFSLSNVGYNYIQFASVSENTLALIYSDNEDVQHFCTMALDSGEVITDTAVEESSSLSSLGNNGAKEFTLLRTVYGENGKEFYFESYDNEKLELKRSENLNEKLGLPETADIYQVTGGSDGSAYIFATDYGTSYTPDQYLCGLDAEGNLKFTQKNSEKWKGGYIGMYVSGSGDLCFCTTEDYSDIYAYVTDAATGEIKADHTVDIPKNSGFIGGLRLPGFDIAYITSAGVTGYSFETKKSEVVLPFGDTLDPVMKTAYIGSSYGDRVFMYNMTTVEAGRVVTAADSEGKILFSSDLTAARGYACGYCTAPDGRIVYAEAYDPGTGADTRTGKNTEYLFHVLDENGKEQSTFSVEKLKEMNEGSISRMRFGSDGNIYAYILSFKGDYPVPYIYVFDTEGNIKAVFDGAKEQLVASALLVNDSGERAVCINAENKNVIVRLNCEKSLMEEQFTKEPDDEAVIIDGKGSYDLYYMKNNRIYGYRAEDSSENEIMNLENVEQDISSAFVDGDDRVVCTVYDSETGSSGILVLTRNVNN